MDWVYLATVDGAQADRSIAWAGSGWSWEWVEHQACKVASAHERVCNISEGEVAVEV